MRPYFVVGAIPRTYFPSLNLWSTLKNKGSKYKFQVSMTLKMRVGCTRLTFVSQWVATLLPSDARLADFPLSTPCLSASSALSLSGGCHLLAHAWSASLVSIAPLPCGHRSLQLFAQS